MREVSHPSQEYSCEIASYFIGARVTTCDQRESENMCESLCITCRYSESIQAFAIDIYYSSLQHGPEHIRTAPSYFHMGRVFQSYPKKKDRTEAFYKKVIENSVLYLEKDEYLIARSFVVDILLLFFLSLIAQNSQHFSTRVVRQWWVFIYCGVSYLEQ